MSEERSPSGAPIYRHKAVERPTELIALRSAFADRIEKHMDEHLGPAPNVLHEIVSDRIHLDVHVAPPTKDRPWFALYTTGMSTRPMNLPEGVETFRYAEMMIGLPENWPGLDNVLRDPSDPKHPWRDEANYWPIRLLKMVAKMPAMFDTWLGYGHTVGGDAPDEPFAPGTRLTSALINLPVGFLSPDSAVLHLDDDVDIVFFSIVPLYPEERDFKLKNGADALMDLFDKAGIGPVIDPQRPSVVKRKKKWWFF